nr:MAG TPA: protein of unknown function (DUF3885) [Caudoviricetes sp.]
MIYIKNFDIVIQYPYDNRGCYYIIISSIHEQYG